MTRLLLILCIAFAAACGGGDDKQSAAEPVEETPAPKTLDGFALKADPGSSITVHDAKKSDAEQVVVEGRVQEIVSGYASFKLIDKALEYCGSAPDKMDNCPTPWDYCCVPQNEIVAGTLLVEMRDDGKIIKSDELPGLRLLDLVVVKGKRVADEHGNVTILADGWFRRERPELRDDLLWPE